MNQDPADGSPRTTMHRRRFLAAAGAAGLGAASLPQLLAQSAPDGSLTAETLGCAERVAGLEFSPENRDLMLKGVNDQHQAFAALRQVPLPNQVAPALRFATVDTPATAIGGAAADQEALLVPTERPDNDEELAFLPVVALAYLVRTGQVSSLELTNLALERLRGFDPHLHCVVTLTEERALAQARRADVELASGTWRGPLHGIPWGAKDLLAVAGYPTTWGAEPFREQVIEEDATVVRRLDDAGAVLVAKLTLGELAMGDVWFGGMTRNPWNLEQGSSGSSAGSAAAVAAGLVPFAIGSETRGSIISPCTRCGATGLRPTFGRVSRHGAMALAWSMDKLGPITRSVSDCALVMAAIHGADGRDETARDLPFPWDPALPATGMRLGVLTEAFEAPREGQEEWRNLDLEVLDVLRHLEVELVPMALPDLPLRAMDFILGVEAAAAFDELTRSGRDALLARQSEIAWPNRFRQARMVPAVEYLQANRVRALAMQEMERILTGLDGFVAPSFGGQALPLTNLTGHPAVVLPNGFRSDGTPTSITFTGTLFGEARLLGLARAYQQATDFHTRRPLLP